MLPGTATLSLHLKGSAAVVIDWAAREQWKCVGVWVGSRHAKDFSRSPVWQLQTCAGMDAHVFYIFMHSFREIWHVHYAFIPSALYT